MNRIIIFLLLLVLSSSGFSQNNANGAEKKTNLKILTFNAGLLEIEFFGMPLVKPADFLPERLAELPKRLIGTDADIIAVQEIYLNKHQTELAEALKCVYPYVAYKRTRAIKSNNGLMIFSKYPIKSVQYKRFKQAGGIDERTVFSKGLLAADIELSNSMIIRVIDIHPTSGGVANAQDCKKINGVREDQIRMAYDFYKKDRLNTIILGDFNSGPEIAKENYEFLANLGFLDTYKEYCEKNNLPAKTTWSSENYLNATGTHTESISQRIDHIFISPELISKSKIIDARRVLDEENIETEKVNVSLSDHYGVLTTLEIDDEK